MSRPRDEIWDTLDELFGPVRTKPARSRRNAAVKELRDAGATPEEIRIAYDYCRMHFTTFTEMAVSAWLDRALHERRSTPNPFEDESNVVAMAARRRAERKGLT